MTGRKTTIPTHSETLNGWDQRIGEGTAGDQIRHHEPNRAALRCCDRFRPHNAVRRYFKSALKHPYDGRLALIDRTIEDNERQRPRQFGTAAGIPEFVSIDRNGIRPAEVGIADLREGTGGNSVFGEPTRVVGIVADLALPSEDEFNGSVEAHLLSGGNK